jgi:serine/threonine protein kinase
MIGQTISHYRILEKLGEGGMGVVYKAQDLKLNRIVALKFLPHRISANETEKARFLQEAQAAAVLNHPNICTIHTIEDHEGEMFIVMECVDGKTLREMIADGSMQIADCIKYAIEIGDALAEAHSKGIVHRDVKAENVMVNSKNQIKVMDFGLAKLKGSLKLTKASSTVGTLAYMAPEQIQGGEVDARSDIFSFGVLLFEMLTGRLPFRGEHDAAMMYSIVNEQPEPIEKYLPEVSSEFLHIFNRALEKDPEERYQTVRDMVIDLRRLKKNTSRVSRLVPTIQHSEDPDQSTRLSSKGLFHPPKKHLAILLVSAFVVVCATVVVLLNSRSPELNPDMKTSTLPIPFQNVRFGNVSKDGLWLVFPASDDKGKWDVYGMNMSKGQPRNITNDSCDYIRTADISPDASTIIYTRGRGPGQRTELVSVPFLGGAGRVIVDTAFAASWRPDGERIGYLVNLALGPSRQIYQFWTARPDGSDRHPEFVDTLERRIANRWHWAWSPDMKSVAWTKNFAGGYSEIVLRNLETGKESQLTYDKKIADDAIWTQNDQIIFSSDRGGNGNIWIVPSSGGKPVQVTRGSGPDSPQWVSADCRRMFYKEGDLFGHIKIGVIADGSVRQLTVDERLRSHASISPSGALIAFAAREGEWSIACDIYLMDRQRVDIRKLTDGPEFKQHPYWSRDEKWITYSAYRPTEPPDSSRVYLIKVDNPSQPRFIGKGTSAYWFSEKEFIVSRSSNYLRGSVDYPLLLDIAEDSVWICPILDGKYLAVGDHRVGRKGAWITTTEAYQASGLKRARQLLMRLIPSPLFARGGKDWFYTEPGTAYVLHRISLPDGKDERIAQVFPGLGNDFSVRSDGKEIVYVDSYRKARYVIIDNLFK